MTDGKDILTEEDGGKIIRGLLKVAGRDGLTRDELLPRFEAIADHVRELKIGAALYEIFSSEDVFFSIGEDGEVRYVSAARIAERDANDTGAREA